MTVHEKGCLSEVYPNECNCKAQQRGARTVTARMEEARKAVERLDANGYSSQAVALKAEVEEWEAERARLTEPFVARDQLPAAFTLMKARAEAADAGWREELDKRVLAEAALVNWEKAYEAVNRQRVTAEAERDEARRTRDDLLAAEEPMLIRCVAAEDEVERWHREALDWQQAKSEADDAYDHAANRAMAAVAEADRLKAALEQARARAIQINTAGFDSTRGEVTLVAINEIDAALAPADRNTT